jgi:hypothetical protein
MQRKRWLLDHEARNRPRPVTADELFTGVRSETARRAAR